MTSPQPPGEPTSAGGLEFAVDQRPSACPRCGGEGLLSVTKPCGWRYGTSGLAPIRARFVLCPVCDAADPVAGPLWLFFAVHGQVTAEAAREFAWLAPDWAARVRPPEVDRAALEREIAAWRRGEMDEDLPGISVQAGSAGLERPGVQDPGT